MQLSTRCSRSMICSVGGPRDPVYGVTEPGMEPLHTRRCECGAVDCVAVIEMTWAEQDEVDHTDDRPVRWAIWPGHEPQGGRAWHIVRETDRFVVVEVEEAHS